MPKIAYSCLQLPKTVSNFLNFLEIANNCLQFLDNELTTALTTAQTFLKNCLKLLDLA